jgi:hypothetical protein
MKRRAFIMPLVLMLTMVLTLTAAFVLQRQGSQSMIQRRHMAQYESHHTTRGVADVIEAWLTGGGRYKSFRDRIDGDGKILDITVPDGLSVKSQGSDVLRISVKDAQGTLLSDFSGLTGQSFLDSKAALDALRKKPRPTGGPSRAPSAPHRSASPKPNARCSPPSFRASPAPSTTARSSSEA